MPETPRLAPPGFFDFARLDEDPGPEGFMKPHLPGARSQPRVESFEHPSDESTWIARSRAGDTRSYRLLVERHRSRVYGLALRILRSPADAEEVAQDAFVRAWLAIREFRGDSSFATWLYRITARRALDRAAVLKSRRARETTIEDADEASMTTTPLHPGARQLDGLLEALSPPQRAVIALFYFEDHPVQEIARALGMPDGTVKTHLSRARAALRLEWNRRKRLEGSHEMS